MTTTTTRSIPRDGAELLGAILFTPGDRPERFDKGWSASRQAMILDLEDAVAVDRKPMARKSVSEWIGAGRAPLVRVNAVSSPYFANDVAQLAAVDLRRILIPKANSAADIKAVRAVWPKAALYPLIETPWGLDKIHEVARAPGVCQLVLGALDLHAACGVSYPNASFLDYCRIQLLLASRIAGLPGPIDTPHPSYKDHAAVASEASAAAKLGFNAKLCIHPSQLETVNAAFLPTADEVAWAEEVVAAGKAGGAAQVRGAMIDAPVIASAQQILERNRKLNVNAD